jgi:vesicle transport through interaction with t-SNAREs protein 1
MSNLIDADAGTERFSGYEAELKLVQADLNQQLEQIKETTGEPRKAAISKAERALEEAEELVCTGRRRLYRASQATDSCTCTCTSAPYSAMCIVLTHP